MAISYGIATDGGYNNTDGCAWLHNSGSSANTLLVMWVLADSATPPVGYWDAAGHQHAFTPVSAYDCGAYYLHCLMYALNQGEGELYMACGVNGTAWYALGEHFTGASQTIPPEAHPAGETETENYTASITTTAANAWLASAVFHGDATAPTAGANATQRVVNSSYAGFVLIGGSAGYATPGPNTFGVTGVTTSLQWLGVSIAPAGDEAPVPQKLVKTFERGMNSGLWLPV